LLFVIEYTSTRIEIKGPDSGHYRIRRKAELESRSRGASHWENQT